MEVDIELIVETIVVLARAEEALQKTSNLELCMALNELRTRWRPSVDRLAALMETIRVQA